MIWFLNLFRRKPVVKLFALVGAVILWLFVMQDQNPMIETSYNVPITMLNAPEGSKIDLSDETVKIKLRGARSALTVIDRDELKAVINLAGLEAGTHHIKVHTVIPQGVEAEEVSPDMIDVTIDPIVQRTVEINLIRAGQTPQDMAVASVTPSSPSVTIEGPRSAVQSVAQVIGYVGMTQNSENDFDLKVPLSAIADDGHGVDDVRVIPQSVNVHVQLARGLSKKIVDIKPLFEGAVPSGYSVKSVRMEPSRVEIAGEASVLNKISSLDTETIPLADLTKSTRRAIMIALPDGVTVTNKMVFVNIEIEKDKN